MESEEVVRLKAQNAELVTALKPFMRRLQVWREMLAEGSLTEPISDEWLAVEKALSYPPSHRYAAMEAVVRAAKKMTEWPQESVKEFGEITIAAPDKYGKELREALSALESEEGE